MIGDRERFAPAELAAVLAHYEVGALHSARELPRGSRRAPKLLLQTDKGAYLLKRRAPGRDRAERVEFTHALLAHLATKRFPTPRLQPTVAGETLVRVADRTYELFVYVPGERYEGTLEQTTDAGRTLARFHRAVLDFATTWRPPTFAYHDLPGVREGLNSIPTTTATHESVVGREAELLGTTQALFEHYEDCAAEVNALGIGGWRQTVIHGDWHPGNLVFEQRQVICVLDLDAARLQPPVIDVANGMLQFSILRGSGDPEQWPEFFDETRMRRFLLGYRQRALLSEAQKQALLPLIIESLIAESVAPIAVTGSFGTIPGFGILRMVRRKVNWLLGNRGRLVQWMLET